MGRVDAFWVLSARMSAGGTSLTLTSYTVA